MAISHLCSNPACGKRHLAGAPPIPASLREAVATGAVRYFTGKPCKYGHLAPKLVSTRACVECAKNRYSEWYSENKEAKNAYDRVFASERRVEAGERWQKWYGENRKRKQRADLTHIRNYRAKKQNADGSHSSEDVQRIRRLQSDKCGYCRSTLSGGGHVDHIKPLSKGGSNRPRNLQLLCVSCNTSKGARDPLVYARTIGKLL